MTPERKAQLDSMTEADKQADIIANIKAHGAIRIESRQSLAFWGEAIYALERGGQVKAVHKENYEGQYSWLEVTLAEPT